MPRKKNEAASKTRISVLMQDWLYTYKRATIAPRTYESCARRVRLHVYPAFGDHFPGNISCEMVQKHINKLYDSGMALDSVKKVRQTMSQFFQYLVDNLKILTDNPVVKTKIHTKTRKDISEDEDDYIALPKEDRIRMIKALEEHQTLKPIVLSMMLAGMRIGEVLALKWRNVNLTDGILHIGEAVTVIPKVDEEGNVLSRRTTISNTKTCASVRSVPIPLNLTNALKEWKEIRTALQEKTGGNFVNHDSLVFSTDEGTLRTYNGLRTILNRFLRRHGMDKQHIHFHTFRHTFATMLFETGVNPRVVQLMMGHKDVETTLAIYTHVAVGMLDTAAEKLDGMLEELSAVVAEQSA
ncbi:MAG: site-specific integrase [Oscillospiraceae bacterium]|nr:site-specific integrase [Oscillospiraceae bacterium]